MLESVDLSRPPLPKEDYKPRRDALMEELVVLQQEAVKKGVGLVVLFEGWNGAGKGSRISDLMYNLDARATSVYVTEDLDVEAARAFAGADQGVTGFFPVMQERSRWAGRTATRARTGRRPARRPSPLRSGRATSGTSTSCTATSPPLPTSSSSSWTTVTWW